MKSATNIITKRKPRFKILATQKMNSISKEHYFKNIFSGITERVGVIKYCCSTSNCFRNYLLNINYSTRNRSFIYIVATHLRWLLSFMTVGHRSYNAFFNTGGTFFSEPLVCSLPFKKIMLSKNDMM